MSVELESPARPMGRRLALFAVVVVVCVVAALLYVSRARHREESLAASAPPTTKVESSGLDAVVTEPHVLFRSTAYGDSYGRLSLIGVDDLAGARVTSDVTCDRVAGAADRVICLSADRGLLTTYKVTLLDDHLRQVAELPLEGIPSRARISSGGTYAAATSFVSGDSYAAASFSTRTVVYDARSGVAVANLEDFAVTKDGESFESVDFNFLGVTFVGDGPGFFATLGTGGHQYLVRGDVSARTATVLRDGIECPSLSPDGTRIAFKKRSDDGGAVRWRISVLDLSTLEEHPLAEDRSVDDQVAWLDDHTLLYALPRSSSGSAVTDTWQVPADGSGAPAKYLDQSESVVPVGGSSTR